MSIFLNSARNRADLYHVGVPLFLVMVMTPTSLGGALLFLLMWAFVRALGHG